MTWVMIDFETASDCDLKSAGAWRYAEDITTEILCLSYSVQDGPPQTCTDADLRGRTGAAEELFRLASDGKTGFLAHNCQFEKAIWSSVMTRHGWPGIAPERWHDVMASCAYRAIPLGLDRACRALRVPQMKDMAASRFTTALSKPQKDGSYDRGEASLRRVGLYCEQDIRTQVSVHKAVGWLPAGEREVWLLDQRINRRGVCLDLPFISAAQGIVDRATEPLAQECLKLTGGISFTQRDKLLAWCRGNGAKLKNLQKGTVDRLLGGSIDELEAEEESATPEEADDLEATVALPEHVRRVLSIRRLVGSASVKKLRAMQGCICADGRARGLMQYHGAGTGRWAGRLIQVQNFPRGSIEIDGAAPDPAALKATILSGDIDMLEMLYGPAVETVLSALRHAIIPTPGKVFVCADYASIEARVILALAGEHDKCQMMANGLDIYCNMAGHVYHREITKADKKERKVGKESVLGCGFGMGKAKFRRRVYQNTGILLTSAEAEGVVRAYRESFAPGVPKVWRALEYAALEAVRTGNPHEAYGIQYRREGQWLSARLPSGRKIWYFDPQLVRRAMPWDETDIRWAWTFKAQKTGQWKTIDAYGGLLTENAVQAIARDLLAHGLFAVERAWYEVVMTVHDEAVAEADPAKADVAEFEQLLADRPPWAAAMGIPVAAEGWKGDCYRK